VHVRADCGAANFVLKFAVGELLFAAVVATGGYAHV
jgi:hypothetical protein